MEYAHDALVAINGYVLAQACDAVWTETPPSEPGFPPAIELQVALTVPEGGDPDFDAEAAMRERRPVQADWIEAHDRSATALLRVERVQTRATAGKPLRRVVTLRGALVATRAG